MSDTQLARPDNSPVSIIREAMSSGQSPEYLRELLAVRREWEADEARKEFNVATSDFQRRCPIIPKEDKGNKAPYARLDRIWRTIRPLMGELGLSVTWQICELRDGSLCHVEGKLAHKSGHFERIVFDVPTSGVIKTTEGKEVTNVSQMMGSAHTYAQRYATCSALGIVTGDDDDGFGAGSNFVTLEQSREIAELVDTCRGINGFNEPAFWGFAGASNAQEILAIRHADVVRMLKTKIAGGGKK